MSLKKPRWERIQQSKRKTEAENYVLELESAWNMDQKIMLSMWNIKQSNWSKWDGGDPNSTKYVGNIRNWFKNGLWNV